MKILNRKLTFSTKKTGELINITGNLQEILSDTGLQTGNIVVFVSGSTAGILTFEYEPGLIHDIGEFFENIAPSRKSYSHDETWGDANGFSHIRAAVTGQSFTVPFDKGELLLGTWQQVVLAEFDNRPRTRDVTVQILGE
ncbi:MAG TPA: secondary thiamine-phosphate synthase enzyme YjbQ [Syntrophorhabdaceae bacterium]|nr:secondary thiamine-phosphate synthase enzyme YjbQ [Syntrophorhabdaceae bacterium]